MIYNLFMVFILVASFTPPSGSNRGKSDHKIEVVENKKPNKRFNNKKRKPVKEIKIITLSLFSNFKEKVQEAESELLKEKKIFVHAVGPSIPHGINLAMHLQKKLSISIEANTSMVYNDDEYSSGQMIEYPSIYITLTLRD